MRLDRFLAEMGVGTRNEVRKEIKSGRVSVDGHTIKDPGCKVQTDSLVELNGEPILYEEFVYYMLNKPAGIISASDDTFEETVVDLIAEQKRKDLFPAGRLDRDTEGLMLITNDGTLAHRLLSPKHHVDKTYFALVLEEVTEADIESFRDGLILPDGLECMPAVVEITDRCKARDLCGRYELSNVTDDELDEPVTELLITIHEGKFHQIKRMFQAIGCEVIYLKRLTMGTLHLDPGLGPGEYRRLTAEETDSLKNL